MMVTATKSLLSSIPDIMTPSELLTYLNVALRRLGLPRMYMSLTALLCRSNKVIFSSAGMPPVEHYDASEKNSMSVIQKSPPLAGFAHFPYWETSIPMQSGDSLLFMTDGYPERFNVAREMLGFDSAGKIMSQLGGETPAAILDALEARSDEWAGKEPQNDDQTFMLLKWN